MLKIYSHQEKIVSLKYKKSTIRKIKQPQNLVYHGKRRTLSTESQSAVLWYKKINQIVKLV